MWCLNATLGFSAAESNKRETIQMQKNRSVLHFSSETLNWQTLQTAELPELFDGTKKCITHFQILQCLPLTNIYTV